MNIDREYLTKNSWLDVFYLPDDLCNDFNKLWELHPQEPAEVMMYGKLIKTPRYQQSYLKNYNFSGVEHKSLQLPEEFKTYLDYINNLKYGNFDQVLVNWYADGSKYIGTHSDDERSLIQDSPIITISLGEERKFRIRDRNGKIIKDVMTKNGLVLVMGGKFQKEFKHEIVKIGGKKGELTDSRVSITFRQFI